MDQDDPWHAGRPRPWPHCVRWRPSSPVPNGHGPQFAAHVYCGQMAGWMKIPLGTEVDLGPGHIVLDGDPAPPPAKGAQQPPPFGPCLLWPRSPISATAELLSTNQKPFSDASDSVEALNGNQNTDAKQGTSPIKPHRFLIQQWLTSRHN